MLLDDVAACGWARRLMQAAGEEHGAGGFNATSNVVSCGWPEG